MYDDIYYVRIWKYPLDNPLPYVRRDEYVCVCVCVCRNTHRRDWYIDENEDEKLHAEADKLEARFLQRKKLRIYALARERYHKGYLAMKVTLNEHDYIEKARTKI